MTSRRHLRICALLLAGALALAGCDSAEDRAARHYDSARALLAAGDADRALVELRNVFKLQGHHREARRLYAETQLSRGEIADAWGNYLRLVEQFPDDAAAHRALALLAADARDWATARRHAVAGLAPGAPDPALAAVLAAADYRDAVAARDVAARADAVARAEALVAAGGPVFAARAVVIDARVIAGDDAGALAALDVALAERPAERDLQALRLRLLAAAGDDAAVAAQFLHMATLFPDDAGLREALVAWHLDRGRGAEAEAFLRARAEAAPDDPWPRLALAGYLAQAAGPEAALTELERAAAEAEATAASGLAIRLRAAAAVQHYEAGAPDAAVAALEAALAALPAADVALPEVLDARLTLAQMLDAQGRRDAARPLVAAILQADAGHVAALRTEAGWAIAEDRTDAAILLLRRALAQAPRDAAAMMLLAEAHLRDGSRELAGERLSLAVEVSGRGVAESLRYAGFLAETGRLAAAEGVLNDALRAHPGDLRLVVGLAELLIRGGEADRARRHIAALEPLIDRPGVADALERLQALALLAGGRPDDLVAHFDAAVAAGSRDMAAVALSVQARLAEGRLDEAAAWIDSLRARAGGIDPALEFLRAGLHRLAGEVEAAEAIHRRILAIAPGAEGPVRALHGLLVEQGRTDEAAALLAEARALRPEAPELAWLDASEREVAGDLAGAIAIYEALHAADPGNDIFANNLASLLVRDAAALSPEVLARARHIARRLRNADRPEFRATYGRILALGGDPAGALPYLRHAAAGLPDTAAVHLYLGEALVGAGQGGAARAALERAASLDAGGPVAARAAALIDRLAAADAARPGQ